ncbi:helix-turn-helix transcriptional regulator [Luteimonas sp. 3794]|uniref:helix-turn-helix domain-containing protein n=1 Tax=Luteimonas sp. 3794 TaxID=2817730 RepID=UPI002854AA34|nr:helix-turn-helix transcriptional regulator [Luteimonas sp. 3794]MDR6990221.1 transcriptional regulator with XRE-family HTH domain [Luteimonas sp. 3794]
MNDGTSQAALGLALRAKREAAGYSQESFADLIDMHRAYYSAIERGGKNVTLSTLLRICDGLHIKAAELMLSAGL